MVFVAFSKAVEICEGQVGECDGMRFVNLHLVGKEPHGSGDMESRTVMMREMDALEMVNTILDAIKAADDKYGKPGYERNLIGK